MNDELINAIHNNDIKHIQKLIELGADVNYKNKYDDTPLSKAIFKGKIDIIKLLIELGADVNHENIDGETPLIRSLYNNKIDILKLLIELGANVDHENIDGHTPLMDIIILHSVNALYKKHTIFLIKLFIDEGADVNKKNIHGKTCYSYARCYPEILKVLREEGAIVEEFKEDKILYLTHVTKLEILVDILNSKKLYTEFDILYRSYYPFYEILKEDEVHQHPGFYMTLITDSLVGFPIRWRIVDSKDICFVFCKTLLEREDFHWNSDDINGNIEENITSFNIEEIKDNINKKCIHTHNEVIFHHSVSLKYLKEIWVKDEKTYSKVKDILENFSMNIPVKITNKYLDETQICEETTKKLEPNYCWYPRIDIDSIQFVKKLAKKCGLDDIDDIDDPELIKELLSKPIFYDKKDISTDEIKEYLKSKGVSEDTIENLSESKLIDLKNMNLIGLNLLKNYSRFDGGKSKRKRSGSRRKSVRKKSVRRKSVRRKSIKRKSVRRKSVRRKSVRKKSVRRKSVRRKSKCKRRKSPRK